MNERFQQALQKALGQRVRELRTERGYSQEGFADECGVHRTFMGTIERGESNLTFVNIVRVASTLDVTLSALFGGLEDKARKLDVKSATPRERTHKKQAET